MEQLWQTRKTQGYYSVKWYIPLHKLQQGTDIFQAVDVVWNATYLNQFQQAHHWYTQITIKTVVHIQHVLAENIDLKNLLCPSNFQTIVIKRRLYKKGQWSFLITCTKVFWTISYAEVQLTLLSMTRMATKMKKKTQTIIRLCYHLTNKNNKAKIVKMRMIKKENINKKPLIFFKITTYHFEEEAGERINIGKTDIFSK